jgi:hypothetical protein
MCSSRPSSGWHRINRDYMAQYLNLEKAYRATGRVDWIPEDRFPPERVFCMVDWKLM